MKAAEMARSECRGSRAATERGSEAVVVVDQVREWQGAESDVDGGLDLRRRKRLGAGVSGFAGLGGMWLASDRG